MSDPSYESWRQEAVVLGYRSAAAFPLIVNGQRAGVMGIYCDQPGFFDTEEVQLFESLAENLSFAVESHQREQRRLVVIVAADGAEGVGAYAQHRDEIAAVIVDMMMPIMDGPSTIQVLLKLNPRVRIIAASGIDQGRGLTGSVGTSVAQFLAKPSSADTLLRALAIAVKR